MIDFNYYNPGANIGAEFIRNISSSVANADMNSSSFKEVLRETYSKMDNISLQLAGDDDIIQLEDYQVDKTSASASFLITQKLTSYEQVITMMMDILTKYRDWDKSLGQSMSR